MRYWANINGIQYGPLSREELAAIVTHPEDTYVWHKGLDDWHLIGDIEHLADIVAECHSLRTPPPIPNVAPPDLPQLSDINPQNEHSPQPTNLIWAILATILCCQITGFIALYYSLITAKHNNEGNFAKAKAASETGEIWVMLSIALGLISMPITIIMSML